MDGRFDRQIHCLKRRQKPNSTQPETWGTHWGSRDWREKNETGQQIRHNKKSTILTQSSWYSGNFTYSWVDYFDQVSK